MTVVKKRIKEGRILESTKLESRWKRRIRDIERESGKYWEYPQDT
jgi:hypothetical protein